MGLVENATYTARELFLCLMMQSGNDCASALAMANGGLELTVAQMNEEAQRLQAYDTVAVNPSGLPAEGQVSSAYDLALFAREGLARPDFFEYVNTRVIEDFPGYMPEEPGDPRPTMPIATQNPLFIQGYEGAIGVKTGWTTEAGRTFVGAAERGGTSLVVTLLNIDGEIYPSASALLDWGFANIDAVTPVGYLVDPITAAPGGSGEAASLRLSEFITFTATKMARAMITKSTTVWMKAPYLTSTAGISVPAADSTRTRLASARKPRGNGIPKLTTVLPLVPAVAISSIKPAQATRLVPVDPPTRRPSRSDSARIAPMLAASSTAIIRSIPQGARKLRKNSVSRNSSRVMMSLLSTTLPLP